MTSRLLLIGLILALTGALAGVAAQPPGEDVPDPLFVDRAAELGVHFVYFNGASGEYYMPEINGVGVAVLDYDNDGDLDIFFPQGSMLGPGKSIQDALFPPPGGAPTHHRLYRNDLDQTGTGSDWGFTGVSQEAGLIIRGYADGVATGDYDNDGWVDLYLTGLFHNQLFHNEGDGTFTEVTAAAGVDDTRWSIPAAFFDYDRDGYLDLFVGNYLDFTYQNHKTCLRVTGAVDYCGPLAYDPVTDRLFHNEGDGTFQDVTRNAGILAADGPALGVVTLDLTGDRWPDIYVANDQYENQLWVNQTDGTFEDQGLLRGVAVSGEGFPQASMGVLAADFDADQDWDLFMTHLLGDHNTYYRNQGGGLFTDASIPSRLGPPSRWATGFGVAAVDYDNDGWQDLAIANGEVRVIEELARKGDPFPLHQPNQLFHNRGGGRFVEVTERAGPAFEVSQVSRGIASGDLDNDGDTDLVIVNNNGAAQVLINQVGQDQAWLGVRMIGTEGGRDMLGTRLELVRQDRPTLLRSVHTDGSYASGNDPRVIFGLGEAPRFQKLRADWPSGRVEVWTDLEAGRYVTLREGSGTTVRAPGTEPPDKPEPQNPQTGR